MKLIKKSIAVLAIAAMAISSFTTAFASFSEITTDASATTIKAGDSVTLTGTFDTLVGAKGMEIEFAYDDTAFSIDTSNNTKYNFGTAKKPVYYPNYVLEDVLSNYKDEMSIFNAWGMLSYNNYSNGVKFLSTDTDNGYVIADGDEADDMYPYKSVGVIFTANSDIKAGTYDFVITAKVSDSTAGVITSKKTVKITVEGDTPTPSEKDAVAGKEIEDGFKTFSTDAAIEFAVGATPTIEISKSNTTDTLTETLGSGVIGEGKTKIIPIVSYKIGRNGVVAGDTFTIKVTNGDENVGTWTYTVSAE